MKPMLPTKSIVALVLAVFITTITFGQSVWTYDFGTTEANQTSGVSEEFFLNTPEEGGTYRVRIGTQGGGLYLNNPGTGLSTGAEVQLFAATGASTNKFGAYNWSEPSPSSFLKFKLRTSSSLNGTFAFALGTNTTISDNNAYTSHYNTSVGVFWITYDEGNLVSVTRRAGGSNIAVENHGFTKGAAHNVEIYANNLAVPSSYLRNETSHSIGIQSWDLWVDGVRISPIGGWPVAGTLASGVNINGFAFYAQNSTDNVGVMNFDDLEYSNYLPQLITDDPELIINVGMLGGLMYAEGSGPSASKFFNLSGQNLDGSDVELAAPANFEISTDNSNFSDALTLEEFDGALIPIYVRLMSDLVADEYLGVITINGGGVDEDITVNVSGKVVAPFQIPYANPLRNQNDLDNALGQGFTFTNTELVTSSGGYIKVFVDGFVETPIIDLTPYDAMRINFSLATFGTGSNRKFEVMISTNGGDDYTSIYSTESIITDYTTHTVEFDLYSGLNSPNGRIKFIMTQGTGQIRFRDLEIIDQFINTVQQESFAKLKAYPNPFTNEITIANASNVQRVIITNLIGQHVLNIELNGAKTIKTESLAKGIYLVTFEGNNGERVVRRMVKQ